MELQNKESKQAYIRLLVDASAKKLDILNKLMQTTEKQEELMRAEVFDEDSFSETIRQKEVLLKELNDIDNGFEQIYNSVKEELIGNKYRYEIEIKALQDYITSVTDISIRLQVLEQRNKSKLEVVLSEKRKEIRKMRVSNQTAANYYKTMTNQHEVQSFFYDKKK